MLYTMDFNEAETDFLHAVFSGDGPMASVDQVTTAHMDRAMHKLMQVTVMRFEFSMAGAMRWPWSQEARIVQDTFLRVE